MQLIYQKGEIINFAKCKQTNMAEIEALLQRFDKLTTISDYYSAY